MNRRPKAIAIPFAVLTAGGMLAAACSSSNETPVASPEPTVSAQVLEQGEDTAPIIESAPDEVQDDLPIEELLSLVNAEDGDVHLYRQGQSDFNFEPWTKAPTTAERLDLFESEIGFRQDQIEAAVTVDSEAAAQHLMVALAVSADTEQAVERVLTDSPWADDAVVSEVDGFTLIDFGFELDVTRKSELGPTGRIGALAYGDGIVLWGSSSDELAEAIVGRDGRPALPVALKASSIEPWFRIETHQPRYMSVFLDNFASRDSERMIQSLTQYGNPKPYVGVAMVYEDDGTSMRIVIEHETPELADANSKLMPAIINEMILIVDDRPLTDFLALKTVETDGRYLIVSAEELIDGSDSALLLSSVFLIAD